MGSRYVAFRGAPEGAPALARAVHALPLPRHKRVEQGLQGAGSLGGFGGLSWDDLVDSEGKMGSAL